MRNTTEKRPEVTVGLRLRRGRTLANTTVPRMLSVVFPFSFHLVNYNSQGLLRMLAARPHRVTTCGKTENRKFPQSKAIQTCPPSLHCCGLFNFFYKNFLSVCGVLGDDGRTSGVLQTGQPWTLCLPIPLRHLSGPGENDLVSVTFAVVLPSDRELR